MNFKRLYSLREDNDMTQSDIAKICGVSRVVISMWENGKEIIPLDKLNMYANYFNVSMDYIMGISKIKNYDIVNKKLNKELIGKRLREFRKGMNLTQEKLASEINTSHSTISAYENGKTMLLTAFAYEIAVKYNISLDWICGRTK